MTTPHNKPVMDERRFRFILVNVFGSRSDEVRFYDDLLHRLWASEGDGGAGGDGGDDGPV